MNDLSKIKPPRSYRQQLKLLLWSIAPLLLLCYLLAFKKTGAVVRDYKKNLQLQQHSAALEDSVAAFEKKQAAIAEWKKQYLADSARMDGRLLASVNNLCNELELELKEYKPMGIGSQDIWTRVITVEGPFHNILSLVYQLEQKERLCRIASVKYQKTKEGEAEVLNGSLYIQNVLEKK
ncbi:MAG: type 4a pilus biogenesis protein PilO [Niabella sp.]|nr:type 4a pilus biogenesis protein PilO [Niabella sp.]